MMTTPCDTYLNRGGEALKIRQGEDSAIVQGFISSVEGWSARAMLRRTKSDEAIVHEWSTAAGSIENHGHVVIMHIPHEVSSAWTISSGYFDLELTSPSGQVWRPVSGRILLDREVTRDPMEAIR